MDLLIDLFSTGMAILGQLFESLPFAITIVFWIMVIVILAMIVKLILGRTDT